MLEWVQHFSFINCPNFVSIFCRMLKIKVIKKISLVIPRPSLLGIHWPINFTKKNKYLEKKKTCDKFLETHSSISVLQIVPTLFPFFVKCWKLNWLKKNIPSNPPPFVAWNSLTKSIWPKKLKSLKIFKNNFFFFTNLNRDINPGDSWPYMDVAKSYQHVF